MPGGRGKIKPEDNTNGFQKNPENRNMNGRPKGSKNRSTVAKNILQLVAKCPKDLDSELKKIFEMMPKKMCVEDVMTLVQANKAIIDGDTNAYKAIMDSAYGLPKQDIGIGEIDSVEISYEDTTDEG